MTESDVPFISLIIEESGRSTQVKKKWLFVLMTGILLTTAACNNGGSSATGSGDKGNGAANGDTPQIGVAIYKFDDTFMTGVRNAMTDASNGVAQA
ncbi:galactose/methyl galactoside ABC transport system, D-galactose-binding periplasmic protein MglB [Paenibacillus sp. JCM 10914]|nr:galactose/methyl galactoside ABC transport system, D-galactose-binding periplasmic protein MglB [Paenibacillus sp. JCM 10914]